MKRIITFILITIALAAPFQRAFSLSADLPRPEIFFPKSFDTNRAEQLHTVLRSQKFEYLGGLTSYWEPKWSTTLAYQGNAESLTAFLTGLNEITGVDVRLTFSRDLAAETGSALRAGSWWLVYSHTMPDTVTVRINLAADLLGREKLELKLPKARK